MLQSSKLTQEPSLQFKTKIHLVQESEWSLLNANRKVRKSTVSNYAITYSLKRFPSNPLNRQLVVGSYPKAHRLPFLKKLSPFLIQSPKVTWSS